MKEGVDRALGEERAEREGHVGRAEHLLDGEPDRPWESTTVKLLGERHAAPAGVNVLSIGGLEGRRCAHGAVGVAPGTLNIPRLVGGGDNLHHEVAALLEESDDRVDIGVLVARKRGDRGISDHVLEDEGEIRNGGTVIAHVRDTSAPRSYAHERCADSQRTSGEHPICCSWYPCQVQNIGPRHGYYLSFLVSVSPESAAMNASCGTSTRPTIFMRFFPSFCFSRSLRLRVISPP